MIPLSVQRRIGGHTIGKPAACSTRASSDRTSLVGRNAAGDDHVVRFGFACFAHVSALAVRSARCATATRWKAAATCANSCCSSASVSAWRFASGSFVSSSWRTADFNPAYEKSHEARSDASLVFVSGIGSVCIDASPSLASLSSGTARHLVDAQKPCRLVKGLSDRVVERRAKDRVRAEAR